MIVRFGTPRYEVKGKGRAGERKASVFSEKSRDSRMKGGSKIMVAFRGMKDKGSKRARVSRKTRRVKGRKKGKGGGYASSC